MLVGRYVKVVIVRKDVKLIRIVHTVKYARVKFARLRNVVRLRIAHLDMNAMVIYALLSLAKILPRVHKILYVIMDNVSKHPAKMVCFRSALRVRLAYVANVDLSIVEETKPVPMEWYVIMGIVLKGKRDLVTSMEIAITV